MLFGIGWAKLSALMTAAKTATTTDMWMTHGLTFSVWIAEALFFPRKNGAFFAFVLFFAERCRQAKYLLNKFVNLIKRCWPEPKDNIHIMPYHKWRVGRVVMQRIANPSSWITMHRFESCTLRQLIYKHLFYHNKIALKYCKVWVVLRGGTADAFFISAFVP